MVTTQRATPTSLMLRRMTATAVLDALRGGGPMTGTDLIGATGLARPTVHEVCNALIRLGWIREMDNRRPRGDSRRGRPARCYEFESRAGFVLGIDATDRVRARLADLRGDRVAEGGRPAGREAYLPGLPGLDLRPEVGGRFGWPVLVENDANLAAWGERWRGVGTGVDDLVVMVADERLGSGLFLGGRPIRGHAGGAGELRFLELVERVGGTHGIAYLTRTLGAEAVAELQAKGMVGDRGRKLYELVSGDPARVQTET